MSQGQQEFRPFIVGGLVPPTIAGACCYSNGFGTASHSLVFLTLSRIICPSPCLFASIAEIPFLNHCLSSFLTVFTNSEHLLCAATLEKPRLT